MYIYIYKFYVLCRLCLYLLLISKKNILIDKTNDKESIPKAALFKLVAVRTSYRTCCCTNIIPNMLLYEHHTEHVAVRTSYRTCCCTNIIPNMLLYEHHTEHVEFCWRSIDKIISEVLQYTSTHGCTNVWRPENTYIHQLWVDSAQS